MTGAAADHRLPLRPSQMPAFVGRLQQAVERLAAPTPARAAAAADAYLDKFVNGVGAGSASRIAARAWWRSARNSLPEVHAAVHRLNALLGNVGQTVRYTPVAAPSGGRTSRPSRRLPPPCTPGSVETLLILGGNPAYDAPADVDFAGGLAKVPTSIHVGLYRNETAALCQWHVPQSHFLEILGRCPVV